MSRDRDDELADLLEDLSDTLRRLEAEVGPGRRRGPLGLPAPPSPRDVLTFTGEYAIPTAIAVLKANVRILELVGALLQAGARADETRERSGEAVDRLRGETVSQLGRALAEIQGAVEEGDIPETPEARDVIEEARRLNADLREYVREADETVEDEREAERRAEREPGRTTGEETTIPIEDASDEKPAEESATDEGSVEIDVEEELESIKEGMGDCEDEKSDGDAEDEESDGNEGNDDADGSESAGDDAE